MLIIPTHSFFYVKKIFNPQRGESNRRFNTFLLTHMVLNLIN